MKVTPYQESVLREIGLGGKIFEFIHDTGPEYGFDDHEGNSVNFRSSTFYSLLKKGMIRISESPNINVNVYGMTDLSEPLYAPPF